MIIDKLNIQHFRIFEKVYSTRSMTRAAVDLHMTQSGVSQHIKALEDRVGVKLFDRIKKRLVPTHSADALYAASTSNLQSLEDALTQLKGTPRSLSGIVSIGMPVEFGLNIVLPCLAQFSIRHPQVKFIIRMGFARVLAEHLLNGELDCALIDDLEPDPRIHVEKIFDEVLELCAASGYLKDKGPPKNTRDFFETLDYVEYEAGEPILRLWFGHHLGARRIRLKIRAYISDTKGIARLISEQVGAGVLPSYVVDRLEAEGVKLHRFNGGGSFLKNKILLAYLDGKTHSKPVVAVMNEIREQLG